MARESAQVSRFLKKLREVRKSWWTRIEQVSLRGTPDILGCIRCEQCGGAKFIGLEAKVKGGRVTALQRHVLGDLGEVGALASVVVLPEEGDEVLRDIQEYAGKK